MATVISRCELLMQGSNYSGSGNWLDEINSHDAVITNATFDTDHFVFDADGEFMTITDAAGIDFAADDSFTILVRLRVDAGQATSDRILAKKSAFAQGYSLSWGNTSTRLDASIGDGSEINDRSAESAITDNVIHVVGMVRDQGAGDDLTAFVDGAGSGSPTADSTTGTLATATDLFIGKKGYDNTNYFDGDIFAIAIWREALSDADVVTATNELNQISAAVTGTAVAGGVLESEIVTGTETIIVTLTNDTWVATMGDDNAITTAFIAGIDSAQAEAAGWDAEVKGNMVFGDVARTSNTIVTVTLGAEAAYAITADETITVTIPATAMTIAGELVATPTFDVTNETSGGATVYVYGSKIPWNKSKFNLAARKRKRVLWESDDDPVEQTKDTKGLPRIVDNT